MQKAVDHHTVKRGEPAGHDERRTHEGGLVEVVELPLFNQEPMQTPQLPGNVRRVHDTQTVQQERDDEPGKRGQKGQGSRVRMHGVDGMVSWQ